jgi:lysyl-tRNA synthetase class 2
MEQHIHALPVTLHSLTGNEKTLYLHTSPEFCCKKILATGEDRIFTLSRVWRDEIESKMHSPEFTMLEWYRTNANYTQAMADCRTLIFSIANQLNINTMTWNQITCPIFCDWKTLTVCEAFLKFANIDLMASLNDLKHPDANNLRMQSRNNGIHVSDDDDWRDIFSKILDEFIEPNLGIDTPVFLIDYPYPEAIFSRFKSESSKLAERFELYIAGMELASGASELTDVQEHEKRFLEEQHNKKERYGISYPIDYDFLAALSNLEKICGVAMGVDRLVMLFTEATHIENVMWSQL